MLHSCNKKAAVTISVMSFMLLILPNDIAFADVIQITPGKDNTLYQDAQGDVSNGAGEYLFAGQVGILGDGARRRAVLAFDIAGNIPEGSTIDSVSLRVNCNKVPNVTSRQISLRKLQGNWGEGTSDGGLNEGQGAVATTNDATWVYQFFNSDPWTVIGGDFSVTISASINVGGTGAYTFASTSQLKADVQSWVDNPAGNFGWIMMGVETTVSTTKRFDSKEAPIATNRPQLRVVFQPPVSCCIGIRGDIDGNGTTADVQDLTYMINDIYRGGPASPCPEEADLDNSGTPSTVQDLTYLINDIFRGGPNPPACT